MIKNKITLHQWIGLLVINKVWSNKIIVKLLKISITIKIPNFKVDFLISLKIKKNKIDQIFFKNNYFIYIYYKLYILKIKWKNL
jgi:hypothetical protein